jgi:hypothetical protein
MAPLLLVQPFTQINRFSFLGTIFGADWVKEWSRKCFLLLEFFVHLICWLAVAAPSNKSEQDGEQDLGLSKNATFRAIQPSSQLLRHIDDHLLGRRRLVEWRNGGYHTDLRAPLDDVPHGSTEGWLPIQETVGFPA